MFRQPPVVSRFAMPSFVDREEETAPKSFRFGLLGRLALLLGVFISLPSLGAAVQYGGAARDVEIRVFPAF